MTMLSLKQALYLIECVEHAQKHKVRKPNKEEDLAMTHLLYIALLQTPNLDAMKIRKGIKKILLRKPYDSKD